MMTIEKLDNWLTQENITSVELARYLGLTKYTITKWRERKSIPKRLHPILSELCARHRESVHKRLRRQAQQLF
jgi:DNA-binding Xre family transcriptional regulator